jgi:DNA replication and repair protein RecF
MILSSVLLTNFRNFDQRDFEFHPSLTIIVGENARGKTSLLEAVYCSVRGTGFRESKEEELIYWDKGSSLVNAYFMDGSDKNLFQVYLKKIDQSVNKTYYINKSKKTNFSYLQYQTKAVLFAPENINIINGSPSKRRIYIDLVISYSDREYKKRLRNYENALRKRNKILEFTKNNDFLDNELKFWNEYLIEQANYITGKRQDYIDYLNQHSEIDDKICKVEYIKNEFSKERLDKSKEKERLVKKTLIGPQKDDIVINLIQSNEKKNVHLYGSRSEQRMAVFWLKLNEIRLLEDNMQYKPILLLDDIFSELDSKNKVRVMGLIHEYQTVLTTTERELIDVGAFEKGVVEL